MKSLAASFLAFAASNLAVTADTASGKLGDHSLVLTNGAVTFTFKNEGLVYSTNVDSAGTATKLRETFLAFCGGKPNESVPARAMRVGRFLSKNGHLTVPSLLKLMKRETEKFA